MTQVVFVALICACMAAGVYSRGLLAGGDSKCPVGCAANKCVQDKTTGKYRCTSCVNNLIVWKGGNDAGKCACRPGGYWQTGQGATADLYGTNIRCSACTRGSYCRGGVETGAGQVSCSTHGSLTTAARGAKSKWQCVEEPGYGYVGTGSNPATSACGADTYNPGLSKKVCTACPAGFKTNPDDANAKASIASCKVPPGFFLRNPGEVAPCPQGEYKEGYTTATKCTPCAEGVTTAYAQSTAASACNVVKAGYYAVTIASDPNEYVTAALKCPQKYWCPGITIAADTASITAFPTDDATNTAAVAVGLNLCKTGSAGTYAAPLWTRGEGATTADECLVPPGYKVDSGTKAVEACAPGDYRAGWAKAAAAASCTACASGPAGITSEATEPLIQFTYSAYNVAGSEGQITVRGSSSSCKMTAGYGMYKSGDSYRVVACNSNNYGAATATYGLGVVPCRSCPTNMVTSAIATSPEDCVTQAGYGFDGVRSDKCPVGSYNGAANRNACTECAWGYTTDDDTQSLSTACKLAKGFQKSGGVVEQCPVGTYAADTSAIDRDCTSCTGGYTTPDIGSDSADECNVCAAGYGWDGDSCEDCAVTLGYGPTDRAEPGSCVACPIQTQGFRFIYNGAELSPVVVSPTIQSFQSSASQCLSSYAQIGASLWYLKGADETTAATGAAGAAITTLAGCMSRCSEIANCMFYTFKYTSTSAGDCYLAQGSGEAETVVAFKAVPSGDVAGAASAKAIASGMYTVRAVSDAVAAVIGIQTTANGVTTKAGCMEACDADDDCAGIRLMGVTSTASTAAFVDGNCKLIKGESDPAVLSAGVEADRRINYRSMTKVDLSKLQ